MSLLDKDMPTKDVNEFRYHRLERDNGFSESQFRVKEPEIPIKAILIAVVMFLVGSVMIIIGVMLFTGYISAQVRDENFFYYY
jgi:hypothetical protein